MSFSKRAGITPSFPPLQREVVDPNTRIRLWNALHIFYWNRAGDYRVTYSTLEDLFQLYWHQFFHWPLDDMPSEVSTILTRIRDSYNAFPWYRVLDLLEFTADNGPKENEDEFREFVNMVLTEDNSAYRFVGSHIAEITSQSEIAEIEQALHAAAPLFGVQTHLAQALAHLSDRQNRDLRNSIKESISAVEALAALLTGAPNSTLGGALGVLERQQQLHPALKTGFASLYGYTSDAQGIRHALIESPTLSYADAKFMLVACAAFVNYLLAKAADLGISLNTAL